MVRATRGRRSGPMTMSATSAITSSSENPRSNMRALRNKRRPRAPASFPPRRRSGLRFGLALHFALDGLAGDLGRRTAVLGFLAAFAHARLEAAHRAAEIRADVAQLLGAEHQHHDDEDDQPVPDAERAHRPSYFCLRIMGPSESG